MRIARFIPQLNTRSVHGNITVYSTPLCSINRANMGAVDINGNRSANVRFLRTFNKRDIIGYRSTFIPAPNILVSIDNDIAIDLINSIWDHLSCANYWPIAIKTKRFVGVFISTAARNNMNVAFNRRRVTKMTANFIYPTRANIKRHVAAHLATVSAFDSRRNFGVGIVVNKRGVTTYINSRKAVSIAARPIAAHATGINVITASHAKVTADLKIGVMLDGPLI